MPPPLNVQLPRLQKDLRTGSISRDIVSFPSKLCVRRSGMFAEVARSVKPEVIISGKLRAQHAKAMKFKDGYLKSDKQHNQGKRTKTGGKRER